MNTETAPENLRQLQTSFAGHIRDPKQVAAPEGIEDRRMAIYRDLFFNNVKSFLSANFPVLRSLYAQEEWQVLCRSFYREHRCHTPLFTEIPREFLKYLQDDRQNEIDDPAFMLELAHYEWVELALSLDDSPIDDLAFDPNGDLLQGVPVLSPLAWPLSYRFPVHRICTDYQPDKAPEKATHLLVWRKHDFSIHFMQLNEVARLLLQRLKDQNHQPGLQLLEDIAEYIGHPNPDIVIAGGTSLLNEFRDKHIILGTQQAE